MSGSKFLHTGVEDSLAATESFNWLHKGQSVLINMSTLKQPCLGATFSQKNSFSSVVSWQIDGEK